MRLYELIESNILEYRRNPDINVKQNVVDSLLKYSQQPGYYVSFSTVSKVGVNPKSDWATPNGVYAYHVYDYGSLLENESNDEHPHVEDVFPYATNRRFVFILKPTSDVDQIEIGSPQIDTVLELVDQCVELFNMALDENDIEDITEMCSYSRVNTVGTVYSVLKDYVFPIMFSDMTRQNKTNAFNKMLRHIGYQVISDLGTGTIDSNEPIQTVFLSPQSYKVVDVLHNTFDSKISVMKNREIRTPIQFQNGVYTGNLDLSGKRLNSLPKDLRVVDGELILNRAAINVLPDNLTVTGGLSLYASSIKKLPAGLKVGGDLYLQNTQISALPPDLKVGGTTHIGDTPMERNERLNIPSGAQRIDRF